MVRVTTSRSQGPAPAVLAEAIAAIAARADESAFELLFRHFAPRVKAYCMRLGADASLAEEITQEAMVAVWRHAARFDPSKAAASTWIFTIARNLSIDKFRQRKRPQFDANDPAFTPDDDEPPDLVLEKAQQEEAIRKVLDQLSSNEREVLKLSFYDNVPHSEIARRLGLPLGTVKSRIRLAFGKVRALIGDRDGATS